MVATRFLLALSLLGCVLFGQTQTDSTPKQRIKGIRELAKGGSESIPKITPYLSDADPDVRIEAVKAISDIGSQACLEPLIRATRDNDAAVQIYATDGLVNFYMPGYVKTGLSGSIKRMGTAIKSKFTDTNDQVIDLYIQVRPDVIDALGKLVRGGVNMDVRANAARAAGILRGRAALDDLVAALKSKDDRVMYESLIALQKIRDESAGPRVIFLMHDLNDKVQIAAIETAALLRTTQALPELKDVLEHARSDKVRRAALEAIAMLPDPKSRPLFDQYFESKDDALRASAAEGYARLKDPTTLPRLVKALPDEHSMSPRLSMAFAIVALGDTSMSEFSSLRYLINTLNSKAYRGVAFPFLVELTRDKAVRQAVYPALAKATKDERIQLGQILARSGDRETLQYLDALSKDPDTDVAQEGLRSLRTLNARLQ